MKKLIVYYSLEGNTEYIAGKLAGKFSADVLKLVPVTAYPDKGFAKFFWGGKSAVMAEKPKLEPYYVDWSLYDEVIIGFPVWASSFAPPIRTFVSTNLDMLKTKKISAFACQTANGAQKAFEKLKDLIGIDSFAKTATFYDPKDKPSEENEKALEEFCRA